MKSVALVLSVFLVVSSTYVAGATLRQQMGQMASRNMQMAGSGQLVLSPPTAIQSDMPRFAEQRATTPSVHEQLEQLSHGDVKYCGHNICPHKDGVCCLDLLHCCKSGQRCGAQNGMTTCVSRVPFMQDAGSGSGSGSGSYSDSGSGSGSGSYSGNFNSGFSGSGSGSFSGSNSFGGSGSNGFSGSGSFTGTGSGSGSGSQSGSAFNSMVSQVRSEAQHFADQKVASDSSVASGFGLKTDANMRFASQREAATATVEYHSDVGTAAEQSKLAQLSNGVHDEVYGEDNTGIQELDATEMVPEEPASNPAAAAASSMPAPAVLSDRPTPITNMDGAHDMRFAHVLQAAAAQRKNSGHSEDEQEEHEENAEKKDDSAAVVVMRNSNQLYRGPKVGQQPSAQQTPLVQPARSHTDVLADEIAQSASQHAV